MDYYEELGLDRGASESEIRQAYRTLVRLLHPDHCGGAVESRLADLQMKRLNGMMALLADPVERARYDRSLAVAVTVPAPPPVPSLFRWWPAWIWPAAVLACLTAAILLSHAPGAQAPKTATPPEAPVPAAQPKPRPLAVKPAPQRVAPSRAALPTLPAVAAGRPAANEPMAPEPPAIPETNPRPIAIAAPAVPSPPALPPPESTRPAARPTLAGEWLFVPSPHADSSQLYPPEYIELRITEHSGILRGRYQARYRVTDRAISPAVSFQFEGRGEPEGARLTWTGAGGARGDVSLRLLSNGALEVTWVANQIGKELGLISGTAKLVRRSE